MLNNAWNLIFIRNLGIVLFVENWSALSAIKYLI